VRFFRGKAANRLSKNPRKSILSSEKSNDADKSLLETASDKSLNGNSSKFLEISLFK
jgi:hypothetical protein